jgi:cell wall-associated NlpC family hydrolase
MNFWYKHCNHGIHAIYWSHNQAERKKLPLIRRTALRIVSAIICALFAAANIAAVFGIVMADQVVLRKNPSTTAAKVTLLEKGTQVTVLSASGEWYQVNVGGKTGWIRQDLMEKQSDTQTTGDDSGSLKAGSEGDAVKKLQSRLIYLGYLGGSADGTYGTGTEQAVLLYQKRNNLEQDGVAGPATQRHIDKEYSTIEAIIETAKTYQGVPYVRGGFSAEGFDCTGFTKYVFQEAANLNLDRTTTGQASQGIEVPRDQIRPGDLVCFYSPVGHVGLYIGAGKYIHSPRTGEVVKIATLRYQNLTHIRRIVGVLAKS